jgi:hypothetical protein
MRRVEKEREYNFFTLVPAALLCGRMQNIPGAAIEASA